MKNDKSVFANQLAATINKKAVDIETEFNNLESQIKEAKLCLEGILNTSHSEIRESLLHIFLECLIGNKKPTESKVDNYNIFNDYNPLKEIDSITRSLKIKPAKIKEDKMNKFGYPKDLARFELESKLILMKN